MSEVPKQPLPTWSRRRLLVVVGLGVLAALLAALLAAVLLRGRLSGETVLDRAAVERDVAAQFQEREGVAVTLVCPGDMAVAAGRSYRCTGTTAAGETVPVRIVVTRTSPVAYSWTAAR